MSLDRELLQAYQRRWQDVAEVEEAERRQASITQRWQKMNSLLRMAAALGLLPTTSEEESELIDHRWNRLRAIHLAEQQEQPS